MIFTTKILILASLVAATEKENGYYVTVENVSVTLIGKTASADSLGSPLKGIDI